MSMNSDIVKGVVSTSADGYKTFGDIKLYGGNVYKVANDVTTRAVVGRFCYVRPVDGVLTATTPYYSTFATATPSVSDHVASIHCNGFVLEEDSVTGELSVAVSGVLNSTTIPLTGNVSSNLSQGYEYYLDWSISSGPVDTVVTSEEAVVTSFINGEAGVTTSQYPVLRGSIRPIAQATSDGTLLLDFKQLAVDDATMLSDALVLTDAGATSRTVLNATDNAGFKLSSDKNAQIIINDSDDYSDSQVYFKLHSGATPTEILKVTGDGDVEILGKLTRGDSLPLVLDGAQVVVQDSVEDDAILTIRETLGNKAQLALIEGTGTFGSDNNFGFQLEYDGYTNKLSLESGFGSDTSTVFTVDRGVTASKSDIVFKGLITCDPDTTTEGGVRTNYIGGGDLGINSIRMATGDASTGHFNSYISDSGAFTLYGPSASGGELKVRADRISLIPSASGSKSFDITTANIGGTDYIYPVVPNLRALNYSSSYYHVVWLASAPGGANDPDGAILADTNGFTGCHRYTMLDSASLSLGDAVCLDGDLKCVPSSGATSTSCVGIVVDLVECGPYPEDYSRFKHVDSFGHVLGDSGTMETMVVVASVGDSIKGDLQGFKVCNEGGAISAGDLLVTSSTPGRLMKQADDIIRSSTVGKAMQDVAFNDSGEADDIYGFIYCG